MKTLFGGLLAAVLMLAAAPNAEARHFHRYGGGFYVGVSSYTPAYYGSYYAPVYSAPVYYSSPVIYSTPAYYGGYGYGYPSYYGGYGYGYSPTISVGFYRGGFGGYRGFGYGGFGGYGFHHHHHHHHH